MSFQDDQVFLEKYLDEHLNTVLGLRLAETYISTDNLEGAHQTLTEFLESHPDNATAMFLLGEIAFKEGDNEKAQNLYEETIQSDPSYSAAYHRLVTISADGGDQTTVKEIYALLNRLNPLDTRAAAEVADNDSATSLNSKFSKKVLNHFTLSTAEPEEESEIEQDAEPIEPATVEDDEENKISSETFTEPENKPLGGEEVKTEIEVEELTDEEGSFDLDSAGETKEPEVTESDESSSEETVMTDSEESDEFGVPKEAEESNDADNESEEELSESEEPTESESEEPEEDNPFGVGGADDAVEEETEEEGVQQPDNETVEEPVVEETDSDTEETSEETASETSEPEDDPFGSDEVAKESTEDEADKVEQTEEESEESEEDETTETEDEDPFGSDEVVEEAAEDGESAEIQTEDESSEESEEDEATETEDEDPFGSEEVEEESAEVEESAEEQTEDESSEESEDEADKVEQTEEESEEPKEDETTETEDEDPFGSDEVAEESAEVEEPAEEQTEDESSEESEDEAVEVEQTESEESEVDEATETQDEAGSAGETSDQEEDPFATEDEAAAESTDIADSIVDKESRGFELPPFSKETLADIKIDDQNDSDESKSEEGISNMNQDEGTDGLNIPLDSSDDSDNTDNIETATENMIDESGAEEHNIPIDEETSTEDAGSDTPSDYESWVDKDVTPGSMTSGGAENENNISKNTFEGLLSEPEVAVETLESEDPEEESEGTIEEIEDFQKKVDNIYNLDEEEEVSPLQAWFLERNSSADEDVADKKETKTENVDPPLTEPMSVPFSEENSQDESESDNSEDNGKAWDDFVETTGENKKSSVKADSAVSEDSESVVTEVDKDLQNIFDDVVTTESDETDKKEDDTEDSKSASIGGVKLSNDLATFTLAEIYSNQGQYTEALSVLDLLEEKEKDIDKIKSMREEIKKKIEARNK